jgi:hypothetical protein
MGSTPILSVDLCRRAAEGSNPSSPNHNWSVVQLVEHLAVNEIVAGSSPATPANF